jgi:hypothetical protein
LKSNYNRLDQETIMKAVTLSVCALAALALAAADGAATLQSRPLAQQLTTLMADRHLDAIAAKDPSEDGRFVAALYFPNSQLLVISARYPVPAQLQQSLDSKAYRDVYLALQQSGAADSKVFVQDLGADGLHAAADQPVDIVYEHVVNQAIFDKDAAKADAAYRRKLTADDAQYSRMLQLLLDATHQS